MSQHYDNFNKYVERKTLFLSCILQRDGYLPSTISEDQHGSSGRQIVTSWTWTRQPPFFHFSPVVRSPTQPRARRSSAAASCTASTSNPDVSGSSVDDFEDLINQFTDDHLEGDVDPAIGEDDLLQELSEMIDSWERTGESEMRRKEFSSFHVLPSRLSHFRRHLSHTILSDALLCENLQTWIVWEHSPNFFASDKFQKKEKEKYVCRSCSMSGIDGGKQRFSRGVLSVYCVCKLDIELMNIGALLLVSFSVVYV